LAHRRGSVFNALFVRERRILAELDHPCIARLLDGGVTIDGRPWLAMEYVRGVCINQWAGSEKPSIEAILNAFRKVCEAVAYAHQHLVVHRDIKPQNILVDDESRPRLLDFGIAKILEAGDAEPVTQTGSNVLTLQYASPEQVSGGVVTVRSDVYQLGLVLYELLAGAVAFSVSGRSLDAVVSSIKQMNPVPLCTQAPQVPAELCSIVSNCLQKLPAERYQSVHELLDDLRRYRLGFPVHAHSRSVWYIASRFLRRRAGTVAAGLAFVLLAAATVGLSLQRAAEAEKASARRQVMLETLSKLLAAREPFGGDSGGITVARALDMGLDSIYREVDGDSELAADMLQRLGYVYYVQGRPAEAIDVYQHAMAAINEGGLSRHSTLPIDVGMAAALNAKGSYVDAVQLLTNSLPEKPPEGELLSFWADGQLELVNAFLHESTEQAYKRADDVLTSLAPHMTDDDVEWASRTSRFHGFVADVARRVGDVEKAISSRRSALAAARHSDKADYIATAAQNLGIELGLARRFVEAKPLFEEAVELASSHAPGHALHLEYEVNYAGLLYRMGDQESAVSQLSAVLDALRNLQDPHPLAFALRDLSTYAFGAGRVVQALGPGLEACRMAQQLYGPDSARFRGALLVLARQFEFAGASKEAEALLHYIAKVGDPYGDRAQLELALMALDRRQYQRVRAMLDGESPPGPVSRLWLVMSLNVMDTTTLPYPIENSDVDAESLPILKVWASLSSNVRDTEGQANLQLAYEEFRPMSNALERWRVLEALRLHWHTLPPWAQTEWEALQSAQQDAKEEMRAHAQDVERLVVDLQF